MNVAITKLLIVVSIVVLIGVVIAMYSPILFSTRGNVDYVKLLKLIRDKIVLSMGSGTEIISSINFKNTNTRITLYTSSAHLTISLPNISLPWIENNSIIEKKIVAYELDINYNIFCIENVNVAYSSNTSPIEVFGEGEKVSRYYEIYNTSSNNLCLIPVINIRYDRDSSGNMLVKINIPVIRSIHINGRNISSNGAVLDRVYNIVVNSANRPLTSIPYEYVYYGDLESDLNATLRLENPLGGDNFFEKKIGVVEPGSAIYFYVNAVETVIDFEGK